MYARGASMGFFKHIGSFFSLLSNRWPSQSSSSWPSPNVEVRRCIPPLLLRFIRTHVHGAEEENEHRNAT